MSCQSYIFYTFHCGFAPFIKLYNNTLNIILDFIYYFNYLQNILHILLKLREANNIELYERYVIASSIDLVYGLEYIAKYLKMDYLFKLEDDTIIPFNVDNILHFSKASEKFSD